MRSFWDRLFGGNRLQREKFKQVLSEIEKGHGDAIDVSILLDARHWDDESLDKAEHALIALLPRLEFQRSHVLKYAHRNELYRYLSLRTRNLELTLTLIKSLETIGDSRACSLIDYLSRAEGRSEGEQRIIATARACLPYVYERAQKSGQEGMLLRPSDPPTPEPLQEFSLLLRSASAPAVPSSAIRISAEDTGVQDDSRPAPEASARKTKLSRKRRH